MEIVIDPFFVSIYQIVTTKKREYSNGFLKKKKIPDIDEKGGGRFLFMPSRGISGSLM